MIKTKQFKKNDDSFVCVNCGEKVGKLGYSSRDHCTKCLCSLHVDKNPGDRENLCNGLLVPIDIETDSNKGYIIIYKCQKCGEIHKNKSANDDNFEALLKVMNKTYDNKNYKKD